MNQELVLWLYSKLLFHFSINIQLLKKLDAGYYKNTKHFFFPPTIFIKSHDQI